MQKIISVTRFDSLKFPSIPAIVASVEVVVDIACAMSQKTGSEAFTGKRKEVCPVGVEGILDNYKAYKKDTYNEHSCRDEFIDPFPEIFGWDVANSKGFDSQYREVIAEYHASSSDRPDYSLTLRGVSKFFVEAKKPHVDISKDLKVHTC